VQLVEVDGLDAEPPQRRVQGGRQVAPGKAVPVRVLSGGEAALGRDHRTFARFRPGGQPAAGDLLGPAVRVNVGGVDQRPARRDEPVELGEGAGFAGLVAERQGA